MSERSSAGHWQSCLLIAAAALLARLLFVQETYDLVAYRTPSPGGDVDLYWRAAQQIRAGFPWRPSFEIMMTSAPLYPLWLAASQSLLGDSISLHRFANALLFSAIPLLAYAASWRAFGNRVGALTSGLLLAWLPSMVFFNGMLLKVSLEILLFSLLLLALLSLRGGTSTRWLAAWSAGVGGLLSLLVLSQQSTFLYVVVAIGYLLSDRRLPARRRWGAAAGVIGILAVSMLAYGAREPLTGLGQPSFLPQAGINVRIGHHPTASSHFEPWQPVPANAYGIAFQSRLHAEIETQRPLSPAEANRWLLMDAARYAASDPLRTLDRLARRTLAFFNNFEPPGVHYFEYVKRNASVLRLLPVRFGTLMVLAGVGLVGVHRAGRWREALLLLGFIGAVLAANLLSFVSWRFRLPAVVPLSLLAGSGVALLAQLMSRRDEAAPRGRTFLKLAAASIAAAAAAGALALYPGTTVSTRDRLERAASHNAQESVKAERALRVLTGSLAEDRIALPSNWIQRARMLSKAHRHSEAYALVRKLALAESSSAWVNQRYLAYLLSRGDLTAAVTFLDQLSDRDAVLYASVIDHPDRVVRRHLDEFLIPRWDLPR